MKKLEKSPIPPGAMLRSEKKRVRKNDIFARTRLNIESGGRGDLIISPIFLFQA